MPDQQPPIEERRLVVSRPEFDALGQRVIEIERVVWGEERTGLQGLLPRMKQIEAGIAKLQETLEKQAQDRQQLVYFVRLLLAVGGGQIGLKIGELVGLWP